MAWIEKTGPTIWRVRWRRPDGTTGSVTWFRSEKAANNYADEVECDQRRGTWLDPVLFEDADHIGILEHTKPEPPGQLDSDTHI